MTEIANNNNSRVRRITVKYAYANNTNSVNTTQSHHENGN